MDLHSWPPRFQDMVPCDYFLYKERVIVPPLARDVHELKNRIYAAIASINNNKLQRVQDEFIYRLDIIGLADGEHI